MVVVVAVIVGMNHLLLPLKTSLALSAGLGIVRLNVVVVIGPVAELTVRYNKMKVK